MDLWYESCPSPLLMTILLSKTYTISEQVVPKSSPSLQQRTASAVSPLPHFITDRPFSSPIEPGRLVAHATAAGQPMIVVTLNYRLNILAYGLGETDPSSTPNLHIRDLEAGVRWVNDNIASFNGDPSRITLGGESAGSILTHALLLTLPPYIRISRALLCSGSIQSSAPASSSTFTPTIRRIESVSRKFAAQQDLPSASTLTLATTPIPILLSAMAALPLATIPLQHEPSLANWSNHDTAFHRPGLSALMLGDCEFEGVLWLAASRLLTPSSIRATFPGPDPSNATQGLAAAYLDPSPSSPSRGHTNLGISPEAYAALAFLGDHRFSWPNWSIAQSLRSPPAPPATLSASGVKVYQYVFDEPNPWAAAGPQGQGVPRAHHAVDLLGLWGNFDADMPAASTFPAVGSAFRDRVARFVCGGEPWRDGAVFAFGPGGQCAEVAGDDGYQARRRVEAFRLMSDVDRDVVDGVFVRLYRQVAEATRTAMRATGEQQKAGKTVPVVGAKI